MKIFNTTLCLFITLFCITFLSGCSNDDENNTNIKTEQLPIDAQSFLTNFFPDQLPLVIEKSVATDPESELSYKVNLPNDISITFDETGKWTNISSLNGTFPETLDPFFAIEKKEHIELNYPNDPITGITRTFYGEIFTLQSNKQLAFQTFENKFLGETITEDELPMVIQHFVSTHFPDVAYQTIIKNTSTDKDPDYKYMVWMNGNFKLQFDANNKWNELDGCGSLLPFSIIQSLPSEVQERLAERYPDAEVTYILLSYDTRYNFRINDSTIAVIDPKRESVYVDVNKIEDFINKYFDNITSKSISIPREWITLVITVKLPNGFIIEMDENYQWLTIDGNSKPFPESLLPVLPENIPQYVSTHSAANITKAEKSDSGYMITLTNGDELQFNFKGDYLGNE